MASVCYLIKGHEVIFDPEMKPLLDQFTWHINKREHTSYAYASVTIAGKRTILQMHRLLTGMSALYVDHINGNGLDNRSANLRLCSPRQNSSNAKRREWAKQTKYKGVFPRNKKWEARIKSNRKEYYLGVFNSEIEAARAYDEKAKELHGEFARPNFPA